MGRRTTAEICPNTVHLDNFDEKQFYTRPDYTVKGWTYFEGADYGKVYAGASFIRRDLVESVGFNPADDENLENYKLLDQLESQQIYLLHPDESKCCILFSPNRSMLKTFLRDFEISEPIIDQEAIAQTR